MSAVSKYSSSLCFSGPVMKNYRVTSMNSGFIIEVETPVRPTALSTQQPLTNHN